VSPALAQTVNKAQTTTTLTTSAQQAAVGELITLAMSVAAMP
jgi:hypothetical protein